MRIALLLACLVSPVLARDAGEYEHVSPAIRGWFQSLRNPASGIHCCSESDCKRTEARIEDGHWTALAPDGTWLTIEPRDIVHDQGNPTGEPVLCVARVPGGWTVFCFVPGGGV